jgi:hypothetical protein
MSTNDDAEVAELAAKTAEEDAAFVIFTAAVNQASTINELLEANQNYFMVDKSRGSRAYNRAKLVLEERGALRDRKWERKGWGAMGARMRNQFIEAFSSLTSEDVQTLKTAFNNELPRSFKRKAQKAKLRNYAQLAVAAMEPVMHSLLSEPTSSSSGSGDGVDVTTSPPASKRAKPSTPTGGGVTAGEAQVVADLSSSVEVQLEAAKSIKAKRLADAMQHASFLLLTKQQQQTVRDEWLSLLLGVEMV